MAEPRTPLRDGAHCSDLDPGLVRPFRGLREAGPPTGEEAAAILAKDIVMHSPVLIKPLAGRELVAITI